MKSVLISVRPKWCELIVSGKKTIEVRKTRPKLETPFKCYIYETKGFERVGNENLNCVIGGGGRSAVIGEFVCDNVDFFARTGTNRNDVRYYIPQKSREAMCLSQDEIEAYGNGSYLYGLHISNLKIYDKPRELSEFRRPCENDLYCESCGMYAEYTEACGNAALYLRRPPQSWCYVEEREAT